LPSSSRMRFLLTFLTNSSKAKLTSSFFVRS
jgi:hypothetical protein